MPAKENFGGSQRRIIIRPLEIHLQLAALLLQSVFGFVVPRRPPVGQPGRHSTVLKPDLPAPHQQVVLRRDCGQNTQNHGVLLRAITYGYSSILYEISSKVLVAQDHKF